MLPLTLIGAKRVKASLKEAVHAARVQGEASSALMHALSYPLSCGHARAVFRRWLGVTFETPHEPGEIDRERRPLALRTLHQDGPAMGRHNPMDHRQPQARALPYLFRGEKRFEYPCAHVGRDARPGIAHGQLDIRPRTQGEMGPRQRGVDLDGLQAYLALI